jgi:rod shape-determining protein MreD
MKQIVAVGKRLVGERNYESRIDREQSPLKMLIIPIISVMLGSMITAMPFFPDGPLLPPLGFMIFLGWRLMRPGLWPVWAGLPFGLFDDLFSGQPFGCAALLWSLTMLAMEAVDFRIFWRDHLRDWLIAAVAISGVLLFGFLFSAISHLMPDVTVMAPQWILSILTYPLVVRFCSRLDSWRLAT